MRKQITADFMIFNYARAILFGTVLVAEKPNEARTV